MTYITRGYDSHNVAVNVITNLKSEGFADKDISLVSRINDTDSNFTSNQTKSENSDQTDKTAVGATSGGVIGAGIGLLTGLGVMAIPGVGPVVAAGWLAATATGAVAGIVAGGAVGGIVDTLTERGVSESDSHIYAENLKRGGTIVSVLTNDANESRARSIMDNYDPIDVENAAYEYRKSGWTGYENNNRVM